MAAPILCTNSDRDFQTYNHFIQSLQWHWMMRQLFGSLCFYGISYFLQFIFASLLLKLPVAHRFANLSVLCTEICKFVCAMHTDLQICLRYAHTFENLATLCTQICKFVCAMHTDLQICLRYAHRFANLYALCTQICKFVCAMHTDLQICLCYAHRFANLSVLCTQICSLHFIKVLHVVQTRSFLT